MAKSQSKNKSQNLVSRSDAAALGIDGARRYHDQDARLVAQREEAAKEAEHDSRENPLEANDYSAARPEGFFGHAPAGHGENDAPWAREESGGNAEGPAGESQGKVEKKEGEE